MTEVRMSLAEAAALLGLAPNSVRSRFKSNKIRGERDNAGKIWVWIDPQQQRLKTPRIEPGSNPSKAFEIEALRDHVQTLKEQLASAQAELAVLRPEASEAAAARAARAALDAEMAAIRTDLEYWRQLATTLVERPQKSPRSFWGLLRR